MRDHLGYRIEGKTLDIKGNLATDSELNLNMKLVNYGFSAAFNLKSEFVILDSSNKIVSSVKVGNPAEWNNDDELKTHELATAY